MKRTLLILILALFSTFTNAQNDTPYYEIDSIVPEVSFEEKVTYILSDLGQVPSGILLEKGAMQTVSNFFTSSC